MEKIYNSSNIEKILYNYWEKHGYFKPNGDESKDSFCIMIPPPNITGSLHMGHAFQQSIIDTMIRYQRMQGKNTLWQVGIDHAGIATQILVERKIFSEEGKIYNNNNRNSFIKKAWQWKEEHSNNIAHQMRRLGNSVDWERERFTMDEGLSNAVREVFIRLYKEGLIYRAKRLVNWDPKLQTAISDLEVENCKSSGFIWYIRYPLVGGMKTIDCKNYLVVATTRPETLLGDTGIAVNLEDPRYKHLIGKFAIVPVVNRHIPIIGDKCVNMTKGTGCVKITPAHDFNDYKIARRHMLPMINILTFNGNIRKNAEVFDFKGNKSNVYSTEIPREFQNLERFVARRMIVATVDSLGLLEKIKSHYLILPCSDRSAVVIEPMLTDQWFIRVQMLAKLAIEVVKNGNIKFVPKQYENMYFSWMENIQDWCISRQLWWGHRIPAWYDDQGNVYVGHSKKEVYQENNLPEELILHQDNDVLDTWFSSALWTFSTLGWPKSTDDMRQFHPTNVIVSGFDIIFFWIARMIMMTTHFIKDKYGNPQVPFKTVYITGLIRDDEGQKMSKSKGNVIDPLDMVEGISLQELLSKRTSNMIHPNIADKIRNHTKKQFPKGIKPYGADALRFTMLALASTGRDINWNMNRLEGYRNFCNKLWNASRFVLANTKNYDYNFKDSKNKLLLADRWIIAKFNKTVNAYRQALDGFRFDIAANILYEFTWSQFCDWYLEFTKPVINSGNEEELHSTRNTLILILESLLRLAHPIIPFITETIWQHIKVVAGINAATIMLQPFPEYDISQVDEMALNDFKWIKQLITAIRNVRTEMNIASDKLLKLLLHDCNDASIRRIKENSKLLQKIACLESIVLLPKKTKKFIAISKIIDGAELLIPIADFIDKTRELDRLTKEIIKIEREITRINEKLDNKGFMLYAPEKIVVREQEKLANYTQIKRKLTKQLIIINSLDNEA